MAKKSILIVVNLTPRPPPCHSEGTFGSGVALASKIQPRRGMGGVEEARVVPLIVIGRPRNTPKLHRFHQSCQTKNGGGVPPVFDRKIGCTTLGRKSSEIVFAVPLLPSSAQQNRLRLSSLSIHPLGRWCIRLPGGTSLTPGGIHA